MRTTMALRYIEKALSLLAQDDAAMFDAHHEHGSLLSVLGRLAEVPRDKPIVVQCAAGARSSIGASLLKARGVDQVINLTGGYGAWVSAGLPSTP
jgi:rhodanese-related sulfurtransferase